MATEPNLAAIILAAGKGTRMKSDLPKVLHKVAGKSMVSHVVDLAKSLNAKRIITVVAPNSADVEKDAGTEIAIQKEQLGTGDAVKSAKQLLQGFSGDVIILYGDCPLITRESIDELLATRKKFDIGLIGFYAKDPLKYGRLIVDGNIVRESVEYKDATEEQRKINLCNACIYALDAKLLFELVDELRPNNKGHEFYLTDIIKIAAGKGFKTGLTLTDETTVLGINTKAELANAENIIQQRLRHKAMVESGVTMIAPETVFLSADTKFGRNVTIKPNVVIGENVTIGDDSMIGPFAHIRPGTVIGKDVKIGNFVEVKKSTIGNNAKINHLSYVGDSTLGDDVNIGAGTITCNYDGFDKFQTIIEDGVFVGSNSALLAPVTIGKNAIIAAGSVISKDVPAGSLGIARALQKNLAEWALTFRKGKKK